MSAKRELKRPQRLMLGKAPSPGAPWQVAHNLCSPIIDLWMGAPPGPGRCALLSEPTTKEAGEFAPFWGKLGNSALELQRIYGVAINTGSVKAIFRYFRSVTA
jgi:hypothetical protein